MKYLFLIIVATFFCTETFAQTSDLGEMTEKQRNKYLINLGRQVTKKFGPGYYRKYKRPVISPETEKFFSDDKRLEVAKNNGREFYTVTFLYDKSKEVLDFDFASRVAVWKDTGEPMNVTFGNGYGKTFLFLSYKQQTMVKIVSQVPYQQAFKVDADIWIDKKSN